MSSRRVKESKTARSQDYLEEKEKPTTDVISLFFMLAWWDSFRTFEWERALHDPGVIARQIGQLVALV